MAVLLFFILINIFLLVFYKYGRVFLTRYVIYKNKPPFIIISYLLTSGKLHNILMFFVVNSILWISLVNESGKIANLAYSILAAFIFDILLNTRKEYANRMLFIVRWRSHLHTLQMNSRQANMLLTCPRHQFGDLLSLNSQPTIPNLSRWYYDCVFKKDLRYSFHKDEEIILDINIVSGMRLRKYFRGEHYYCCMIGFLNDEINILESLYKSNDHISSFPWIGDGIVELTKKCMNIKWLVEQESYTQANEVNMLTIIEDYFKTKDKFEKTMRFIELY